MFKKLRETSDSREQKSANVKPVKSEEEAISFIEEIKKKHYNARHNCYAYVLGKDSMTQRMSDDGEPQGTAGIPMLEVLLKREICDVCVVVTRYFGGILLGTGGLIRAYQEAVIEGLNNSTLITKEYGKIVSLDISYTSLGKIQYILANNNAKTVDTVYGEGVILKYIAREEELGKIEKEIIEATSASVVPKIEKETYFSLIDGEIVIWES